MNGERHRLLKQGAEDHGPVLYWMSRDQRVRDNWALLFAQNLALLKQRPLVVGFCLAPEFMHAAAMRQYRFMLKGIRKMSEDLATLNILFLLLLGNPEEEMAGFVNDKKVALIVTDFDPLRINRAWKSSLCKKVGVPVYEVDAHNIVPCWKTSPKQEYGAFTFRPKIRRLLDEYLEDFPPLETHPFDFEGKVNTLDWRAVEASPRVDTEPGEVTWITPGEDAALRALNDYIEHHISHYPARNDPNADAQSDLSPYLHFGQLSAQRVAMEVKRCEAPRGARDTLLEELIVRRELSDNFCYYNEDYDRFEGFPEWARKTLNKHREDARPYDYDLKTLENGETHDELWNAAQIEMVKRGKMAGYMRMYWAKKILEWSLSPETAMEIAIYLNDRYELDGRDPNGYTGIGWSIGGVHDRPWRERNIFGNIRYMSYNGCKIKFDVSAYAKHVNALPFG